jgi:acetyl/propionyl-CoA carboxylase alpha subunit
VPIHYDPLIAKLVTFGSDRSQAIARMRRALQEYRIEGIKTNLKFFSELLSDPEFVAGDLSTGFIEEHLRRKALVKEESPDSLRAHAVAAALAYSEMACSPEPSEPAQKESAWRLSARPGGVRLRHGWRR